MFWPDSPVSMSPGAGGREDRQTHSAAVSGVCKDLGISRCLCIFTCDHPQLQEFVIWKSYEQKLWVGGWY